MRLSESKIREAILHADLDVRDAAIRYFYNSTTADHTLMPMAIEAIERYGRSGAFSYTHYLNLLPQSEATIVWVIGELQRQDDEPPAQRHFYFLNLSRLLCRADVALVTPRCGEILKARHFDAKQRAAFLERLDMLGWSAETCWKALRQHCEASKHQIHFEDFDLGHAERIMEALARQPHDYDEQILEILAWKTSDYRPDGSKWLHPLMAILAGKMRLAAAIPLLVANLGHDDNFLADRCMFALANIGTEEVISAVQDRFPRASRDFRRWASDLLSRIHLDQTVQCVLSLLPGEIDLATQTNLHAALIDHFAWDGIEPVRHFIESQELEPEIRHLRSSFVAACKIMDVRFPGFDIWQAAAQEDAAHAAAHTREIEQMAFEAGGDLGLLVEKMKAKFASKTMAPQAPLAFASRSEFQPPVQERHRGVFRREQAKVGRNDRCPCGSGKKYKVCCMRRYV